jgi:predicted HicB family RNase H-like nuclease
MLKRNIQINFRVDAEEQELIKTKAKRCGLSIAKYLRFLIHDCVPKEQPPADYKVLIRELHAIGNSMNQIAARANATGYIASKEYAENAEKLNEAILNIQEAVTGPEAIYGDDEDMAG